MSRRTRWVVVAAALLAVVVAAATYVVTSRRTSSSTATRAPATRPPALAQLASTGIEPTAAKVASTLAAAQRDPALGGGLRGAVVDAITGRQLFDVGADIAMTPASTVKLLTAAAALDVLGPNETLSTGVVRSGDVLYLVGGGDVTLAAAPRNGYPAVATVVDLAARTATALGTTRSMRLCLDTSAWVGPAQAPGWNGGYFTGGDIAPLSPLEVDEGEARPGHTPRVADPALQAATAFAVALRRDGVDVAGRVCHGAAPPSGLGLAAAASAPVSALVQRMLTDSDNDLAESLGRAVAVRAGQRPDFAGEAAAVTSAVSSLGVAVDGVRLYDASGLSRRDRVTARALVELLQLAASAQHPGLRPLVSGLPVAGLTGTLADRYRRAPAARAAGVARAKTGTLAGVNAIAGFVVDADRRLLVFAFLTDHAAAPAATEAALDRVVGRLAGCGCT